MKTFFICLIIINLLTIVFFIYDKTAAKKELKRIPETTLHFLEFLGGVFAVIVLMYVIHHKNRKFRYYVVTYLWLILWVLGLLMVKFELYRLARI